MAENSKIEWTDHTFNPWIGCAKVSPGCAHCYAEEMMDRRYGKAKWGPAGTRVRTSDANWKMPLRWNREAEKLGQRARVFCASLADVFEDREELVPWRTELFALIRRTPHLDWLLLTKRPENIMASVDVSQAFAGGWRPESGNVNNWFEDHEDSAPETDLAHWLNDWRDSPPANVWLGTSVENQKAADERIPHLLACPARVRFLSCEPLLGSVDLTRIYHNPGGSGGGVYLDVLKGEFYSLGGGPFRGPRIHWVICGGESGSNARPMHPDWARSLRDQCAQAGVPFLFKQWGEYEYFHPGRTRSGDTVIWPDGQTAKISGGEFPSARDAKAARRVGKHAAGRLLDGVLHDEFPEVARP